MVVPQVKDAFKLLMRGEKALTAVSANGMRVDVDYFKKQHAVIGAECEALKEKFLHGTDLGRFWLKKYGYSTNIDSSSQIRETLKDFGFDKFKVSEKGNLSVDKTVIEKLPEDAADLLLKRDQLKILWQSLIKGIIREVDNDGFIHPIFNLHTVKTYRGSCDSPNLQQMPKHNEYQKHIVRSGFYPRTPDRQLMEIDLQSAEVTVGCCLHKDPAMLDFLHNPNSDMHKTVAKKFYNIPDELMNKTIRNSVKGRFVFASFYGASYESIGKALWEYIYEQNPALADGTPLAEHMAKQGVINQQTCLQHAEAIFDWYWNDLFHDYGAWKEEVWQIYKKQGYLDFPTGFRAVNKMTKTQAMNIIIQGSTFHLLLNTMVNLVERMAKYKLESKVIGEIHDSVVLDVVPNEIPTITELYIESQDAVRKEWTWLIHPVNADADLGAVGGNWCSMQEYGMLRRK